MIFFSIRSLVKQTEIDRIEENKSDETVTSEIAQTNQKVPYAQMLRDPAVWGVLVAVYFLAVLNNGLNIAGAKDYIANFVNGGALIIGVGLAARLGGRREP